VQVHPQKTPLGADVDFRDLAERFVISGGDIRNAVLLAAQMAAAEEGPDETKRILYKHFVRAAETVRAARQVMRQNAVDTPALEPWREIVEATDARLRGLDDEVNACRTEMGLLTDAQAALGRRLDEATEHLAGLRGALEGERAERAALARQGQQERDAALAAMAERLERRLAGATLIPLPRWAAAGLLALALALLAAGGRFLW
jgi:hypothetical protein